MTDGIQTSRLQEVLTIIDLYLMEILRSSLPEGLATSIYETVKEIHEGWRESSRQG